jgi:hypothetical protein
MIFIVMQPIVFNGGFPTHVRVFLGLMPKIKGESSLYAWNDKLSELTYNGRFIV